MATGRKTIVRGGSTNRPLWTAVILLGSLGGAFAVLSLFLSYNHRLTDELGMRVPIPGAVTSLAADPGLAAQIRVVDSSARLLTLADQTHALVVETTVVNDALIPVSKVVMEAYAYELGVRVRSGWSRCGKRVSDRLLKRMRRAELIALAHLEPAEPEILTSGASTRCQVAIANVKPEADEAGFRIASAEPLPGHPRPRFHPSE